MLLLDRPIRAWLLLRAPVLLLLLLRVSLLLFGPGLLFGLVFLPVNGSSDSQ
jgi:hypothetical protein